MAVNLFSLHEVFLLIGTIGSQELSDKLRQSQYKIGDAEKRALAECSSGALHMRAVLVNLLAYHSTPCSDKP